MRNLILSFLILLLMTPAFGQDVDVPFSSSNFPGREKEFKVARKALKKGMKELDRNEPDYLEALNTLIPAQRFNPDYSVLNKAMGLCYLNLNLPDSARSYLLRSLELNAEQEADIHFSLARAYHQAMEFDMAIRKYNDYLNLLSSRQLKNDSSMVNRLIGEAGNAKELASRNARAYIDAIGAPVNTRWDEFLPLVSANDSLLVFTSNRMTEGRKKKDRISVEHIYFRSAGPGGQVMVEPAPRKVQDSDAHTAALYLAPNADRLYMRSGEKPEELLSFRAKKGKWVKDGKVEGKLLKKGLVTSLAISHDTSLLAISVVDPSGKESADIYVATRRNHGWSRPEPAEGLNTAFDEMGVCFHPKEKKLYFSSRGHNSSGGFDLFVSEWTDSGWTAPVNLGFPVNSPFDELFMSFTGEGQVAYISSDRSGGLGGFDLYQVTLLGAEKSLITLRKEPVEPQAELPGTKTLVPAKAIVEPDESVLQKVLIELGPDSLSGLRADVIISGQFKPRSYKVRRGARAISLDLPKGNDYIVMVHSDEVLAPAISFSLRDSVSSDTLVRTCSPVTLSSGIPVWMPTLAFYPDSSLLNPDSETTAQWLVYFLKTHPQHRFEIGSHVAPGPDATHATELTALRASSLSAWLVERGVNPAQISDMGYGFDVAPPFGVPAERIELKWTGSSE